ncbi:uncharacterized protein LOC124369006 [Homalodisca vitripennis]|uniref:uncharacterized protein LOC124369006 n=1 Tax=Homalodisca vitripennis TaxID=197043 RepID=UPI001EEBE129|nr:uncharacterized protein LOC124369006 [Homalodisca vitripennis]KAG8247987.1 hypothetical protein J6590_050284 [Homalodisca vitripennis]
MTGHERLDEDLLSTGCLMDLDCSRYSICQLANGCRCQDWGECTLVRIAGQPCFTNAQCAAGLVCSGEGHSRCVPNTHLEDLPRFADLPEPDIGHPPDIPATYGGAVLVAAISIALVVLCLALAAWYRLTAPVSHPPHMEMASHTDVLVGMNHIQPLPCYSSTQFFSQPQSYRDQ